MKKGLFAITNQGLGHATRELPIIKRFLKEDYHLIILSNGNALRFLKEELRDNANNVEFRELEAYPPLERKRGLSFFYYLIKDLNRTFRVMNEEHKYINDIVNQEKNLEFIISDGRYGCYSKKVPSFIVSHQIKFKVPSLLSWASPIVESNNIKLLSNFDKVFIPDYEDREENLAGELSHPKGISRLNHEYVGVLSSYNDLKIKKDIDYLFIISGYLLEYKDSFVSKLIEQSKNIQGKKVFILGDTSKNTVKKEGDITIYSFAAGKLREELFSRAKTIISRAGYTTVMDLVELNKKAILFPTPHQTEQEYLARLYKKRGYFSVGLNQNKFSLEELIKEVDKTKTFMKPWGTKESVERIYNTVIKAIKDSHQN